MTTVPTRRRCSQLLCLALALCGSGCQGIQSSLAPAGRDAERVAALFWWMAGVALVIWAGVVALGLYYAMRPAGSTSRRRDRWLIVGGGVVFPALALTVLLAFGLAMLPPAVARAPEGSLQIVVSGQQWWWRVSYLRSDGTGVELANELRLPVNQPVQLRLESDNVIHSFWVPSLAGKMDMIPGRITYLTVRPTATGVYRGACAEYCGTAHALMAFYVEVMEPAAFVGWLAHQASPARESSAGTAASGGETFLATGCGACHTVRGTPAAGRLGPDLTHVGGRLSLGAGILPNDIGSFRRWIARTDLVKPGAHMPAFGMLPDDELQTLAAYLRSLQ